MGRKISDQETNEWLTALTDDDISYLEKKMKDYFLTSEPSSAWIQRMSVAEMNDNAEINDNEQLSLHEQHLESQSSQASMANFSSFSLMEFGCSILQKYSKLAKRVLKALIPFPTSYLCKDAMSALTNIKTTYELQIT